MNTRKRKSSPSKINALKRQARKEQYLTKRDMVEKLKNPKY
jgi:hypothetical protein